MNLNRLLAGVAVAILSVCPIFSQQGPVPEEVQLMSAVQKKFSVRGWVIGAVVIESGDALKSEPEFAKLCTLMQKDLKGFVLNVSASQPDEVQRALLLVAAHSLPSEQYRDFLDLMLDEAEAGRLQKKEMVWAMFTSKPRLSRIWPDTFKEPRTINAVHRVQKLFADDPAIQSYCRQVLSGGLKAEGVEVERLMSNTVSPASSPAVIAGTSKSKPKSIMGASTDAPFTVFDKKVLIGGTLLILGASIAFWLLVKKLR